jgi:hypothetical protein
MAHIFHPQRVQEAARRAVGLPHQAMARTVIDDLSAAYPGHIESTENWVMSLAGGATGVMTVLHCSLSEHILIFGTPVGTEGFTGRYYIDLYDFVIAGEMWTYSEDQCGERVIFRPGDGAFMQRRHAKGFRLVEGSWILEYGRGPIVTCLPTGISDAVVSLDGKTVWKTLRIATRLIFKELRRGKV